MDERQAPSWDVFISCAGEDLTFARELRTNLAAQRWSVFLAADNLNEQVGSAQWTKRIDQILHRSRVLVLLVSPSALTSGWVEYEWRSVHLQVLNKKRRGMIIPVCIEGPGPDDLDLALQYHQCVDARTEDARAVLVDQLDSLITGYLRDLSPAPAVAAGMREGDAPVPSQEGGSLAPGARSRPVPSKPRRWFKATAWSAAGACLLIGMGAFVLRYRSAIVAPERQEPRIEAPELARFANPTDEDRLTLDSAGLWDLAKTDFESASRREPAARRYKAAEAFAAARAFFLRGNFEEAIDAYKRAIGEAPDWALPQIGLSEVFAFRNSALALEAADRALALQPGSWRALESRGMAHWYGHNSAAAISDLQGALEKREASQVLRGKYALALACAGRLTEAANAAARALAKDYPSVEGHLALVLVQLSDARPQAALEHAAQAVHLAPDDRRAQLMFGVAALGNRRVEAAKDAFHEVRKLELAAPLLGPLDARLSELEFGLQRAEEPAAIDAGSKKPRNRPARDAGVPDAGLADRPAEPSLGGAPLIGMPG